MVSSFELSELFSRAVYIVTLMEEQRKTSPDFFANFERAAGDELIQTNLRLTRELREAAKDNDTFDGPSDRFKTIVIQMAENFARGVTQFSDLEDAVEPWGRNAKISEGFRNMDAPTLSRLYSLT